MYSNVVAVMDRHLAVWKEVPELSRTNDQFVRNYKKTADLREMLEQEDDPLADSYVALRKELVDGILPLLGVVSVYASDTKNRTLKRKTAFRPGEVKKMDDRQLSRLAKTMVRATKPARKGPKEPPALSNYGFTEETAASLKAAEKSFSAAAKALRKDIKAKKKAAKKIEVLMKRNDNLLKKRIDRMVRLFRENAPDFYKDFKEARKIKKSVDTKPAKANVGKQTNVAKEE